MKRIIKYIFFVVLFCSFLNVFAKEDLFIINGVMLKDKSENVLENDSPIIDNSNIKYDLVFYDTGDYVTYNIKIKNNTKTHYIINDVFDNNENSSIKYEYIIPDNDFDKGEKQTIQMKVIYKNEISSDSVLENSSYHLDDEVSISVDLIEYDLYYILNPRTNPNVIFFYIIFVVLIAFVITLIKKKRIVLSIIILLILLGTYKVMAKDRETFEISLNNAVEIPVRFIRNDWNSLISGSYNKIVVSKSVDIPDDAIDISERGDGSIKGWIDSNGTLYFGSKHRMYTPENSGSFFSRNVSINSIEFEKNSISSLFTKEFGSMFSGLYQVEEIDTSWINTENSTNLNGMFTGCSSLKELNLSGWVNPNVSHIYSLIYGSSSLEKLNLSNWDNHKLQGTFSFGGLGISSLKELNLTNFDISNSSSLTGMFAGASISFPLDLSSWNFSNITTTSGMFSGTNIKKVIFGDADFSSLSDASSMFAGSSLEEVNFENINSSSLINVGSMFSNASKIKKIDLSSFDFSNVVSANYLFNNASSLEEIILPSNIPDSLNIDLPNYYIDDNNNEYSSVTGSTVSNVKLVLSKRLVYFLSGSSFNTKLKALSGTSNPSYSTENTNITAFIRSTTAPDINSMTSNNIISVDVNYPIYAWFDNGTIYYYSEYEELYFNPDSKNMFYNMQKLGNFDFSSINTSKVTDMYALFYNAGYNASSIQMDVSNWDTSNVTDMFWLFAYLGTNSTTWSIGDLSNWNTSNVTRMSNMFYQSGKNATTWSVGDLSDWDTSKVTKMQSMFGYAGYSATTWDVGDLSGWDVSSLENTETMFERAASNASSVNLNLSGWNLPNLTKVTNMFNYFGYLSSNVQINVSDWVFPNLTQINSMFVSVGANSSSVKIIGLSSWNVSNITNMASTFNSLGSNSSSFDIGDLSEWDTRNVTNMSSLFYRIGTRSTSWYVGDLSGWNVSKVTNMQSMFDYIGGSVGDLSNWDTRNVTNMNSMFYRAGYSSNTIIDFGTLNIYSASVSSMFKESNSLSITVRFNNNISSYSQIFYKAVTSAGSSITIDYKTNVTNIDSIIATKSSNSNVVKGTTFS